MKGHSECDDHVDDCKGNGEAHDECASSMITEHDTGSSSRGKKSKSIVHTYLLHACTH